MAAIEEHTGSTMRHAIGQKVTGPHALVPTPTRGPEVSSLRRVTIIASTGLIVAGVVLGGMFWPELQQLASDEDGAAVAAAGPAAEAPLATVHIELDRVAEISIDGLAQPPAREAVIQVTAGVPHALRLKPQGGPEKTVQLPPLGSGAVHWVRERFATP